MIAIENWKTTRLSILSIKERNLVSSAMGIEYEQFHDECYEFYSFLSVDFRLYCCSRYFWDTNGRMEVGH